MCIRDRAHSPCLSRDSRHYYSVGLLIRLSSYDCSCPLAPRKSFDILTLYKSDYYYYYIMSIGIVSGHSNNCYGSRYIEIAMEHSELGAAAMLKAVWWDLRLASLLTHLFCLCMKYLENR